MTRALVLALAACTSLPKWTDGKCNGSAALCDRRFDEVVYPTTHNAMAATDLGFLAANQTHDIARQLEDGVRGLMLDTHDYQGAPQLCHEFC
jgi:hypothetical protein